MDHAQRSKPAASRAIAGFLIAVSAICWLADRVHGQCQYEVTAIIQAPPCPIIGPPQIFGTAVNDHGVATGYYRDCDEAADHGFVWTERKGMVELILPPGVFSVNPRSINDSGLIAGRANALGNDLNSVGFVFNEGRTFLLNHEVLPLEASTSELCAVNRQGAVVGFYGGGSDLPGGPSHAILVQDGKIIDLQPDLETIWSFANDINDNLQITGKRRDARTNEDFGYIWQDGEYIDLGPIPGGITSEGLAINSFGHITGQGQILPESPLVRHAFLWRDGVMTDLGTLAPFEESRGLDINDKCVVVGNVSDPDSRGFVWASGQMSFLSDLVDSDLVSEIGLAHGINEEGQIIATATTPNGSAAVVLIPIDGSPGDLNGNCETDFQDLLILLSDWNSSRSVADIDESGNVGFSDLLILLDNWG